MSPPVCPKIPKDHTSVPYRCQEQQPRSGTAVPSLLDDLEHENAIPRTCVPLCARRQISDPWSREMGAVVWKSNEIKSRHVLYNCRVGSSWQGWGLCFWRAGLSYTSVGRLPPSLSPFTFVFPELSWHIVLGKYLLNEWILGWPVVHMAWKNLASVWLL